MQRCEPVGWSIEARLYAEIPARNFAPSPGLLQFLEWYDRDEGLRVDTRVDTGAKISVTELIEYPATRLHLLIETFM